MAVGISEPEGFKSAELIPWSQASRGGELWGLGRVCFAGQDRGGKWAKASNLGSSRAG